jgi:hypothetical protein
MVGPLSLTITEFSTRVTRRLPLVEQELLTLPGHLSSTSAFNEVRITRSLVFRRMYMFCRSLFLSFCPFSFGHCVVCSSIFWFWLPLWYLFAIVLSVLRFSDSDYPFGIFWPLSCLFFDFLILITPLVSFGHCVVCSSIFGFWLPLWYLFAIELSVGV